LQGTIFGLVDYVDVPLLAEWAHKYGCKPFGPSLPGWGRFLNVASLPYCVIPYFPIVPRGTLASFIHWKWAGRERTMKFAFFAFLVFLGGAIFLLSFVADRQAKLGDDRVARKMSHSVIDARFVSERSPYMRNER
jgi:hypothetical protein